VTDLSHERLNKVGSSVDLILHYSSTRIFCGLTTYPESGPAPATRMEVLPLASAHCLHPLASALHVVVTLGQYCNYRDALRLRRNACKRVGLRNASAS